jgi:hypothetical protein
MQAGYVYFNKETRIRRGAALRSVSYNGLLDVDDVDHSAGTLSALARQGVGFGLLSSRGRPEANLASDWRDETVRR